MEKVRIQIIKKPQQTLQSGGNIAKKKNIRIGASTQLFALISEYWIPVGRR